MSSSATAATTFIDLATFSEIEGFLYGGPSSVTWFVAAVQKSNWFSFIPLSLRHTGTVNFGEKHASASVNRSGDYVLNTWFRVQIPQIEIRDTAQSPVIFTDATIRWTRNLMHNIFENVTITFNELLVQEFDSFWLDFNFQFRKRGSKRIGYRNQIGDVEVMTSPVGVNQPLGTGGYFSVPLPFWFGEDSGIALPVAALPFNDIKINYHFRRWEDLVVIYPGSAGAGGGSRAATLNDVYVVGSSAKPSFIDPTTNCHYAVVHNDERVKMADAPRDILIHQVQQSSLSPFKDISTRTSFDVRLSHSIVLFCFAAQNVTVTGDWSNYTTMPGEGILDPGVGSADDGLDPIAFTTLTYENTVRFAQGSDYFSVILPDLYSEATPDETGYHMGSYSLCPWDPLRPAGSTNYSKLANVSIAHDMSPAALAAAGIGTGSGSPESSDAKVLQTRDGSGALVDLPQVFRHIFIARNWNIVRVANGSLGHPTL